MSDINKFQLQKKILFLHVLISDEQDYDLFHADKEKQIKFLPAS